MISPKQRSVLSALLVVAIVPIASACSKSDSSALASVAAQASPTSPTPTAPTTPTTPTAPTTTVEIFTGSFQQGGYGVHPFTQSVRGPLTMTVTAIGPDDALTVGAGLGTWDGTKCTLISGAYADTVKVGWAVSGTATVANFCAAIYDVGTVTSDMTVTYTLTVEHL